MATNHTTSIEIKHGINTQGFFSFDNPDNLLIFVHGFGGNSIGTWNTFHSSLIFDNDFKKSDIIFYGYDTFRGQANDHAAVKEYQKKNGLKADGIAGPETLGALGVK